LKIRSPVDGDKIDEDSLEIVLNVLKSIGSKLDFDSMKCGILSKVDLMYQMIEKKVVDSMKEKNSYSYRLRFLAEYLIILRKVSILINFVIHIDCFGYSFFFQLRMIGV